MGAPKGKHIFGTVKVGEKGQIVIPKEARDIFDIKPGDSLMILGDEAQGLAIVKSNVFMDMADKILKSFSSTPEEKEFANDIINADSKKE